MIVKTSYRMYAAWRKVHNNMKYMGMSACFNRFTGRHTHKLDTYTHRQMDKREKKNIPSFSTGFIMEEIVI